VRHVADLSEDQPWDHLLHFQAAFSELALSCYPISYLQSIWFNPELLPFIMFLKVRKTTA